MTRKQHIEACLKLLNQEVHSKRGLSGFAIKRAYQTLNALKPNAAYRVIDYLFDDFWAEYQIIGSKPKALSQAWLRIVDEKAQAHSRTALFSVYQMLRPNAQEHVELAVPKIIQLFDQLGILGTSTKFK